MITKSFRIILNTAAAYLRFSEFREIRSQQIHDSLPGPLQGRPAYQQHEEQYVRQGGSDVDDLKRGHPFKGAYARWPRETGR